MGAGCGSSPSASSPTVVTVSSISVTATVSTTSGPSGGDKGYVEVEPGRRIYFPCQGTGQTTTILIAGLGNSSFVWSPVQGLLAKRDDLRVCLFERASLGPSDQAGGNVDAADAVADLLAALHGLELSDPVVLVGASYGGLVAQLMARTHPDRVSGVVLVDSTHADLDARIDAILPPAISAERRTELGSGPEPVTFDDLLASDRAVIAAPPFPHVPLVVIRHGIPFESSHADYPTDAVEALWRELQDDLAVMSPCSSERLAATSGHRIHQDQPDLVAQAITDVAASVQSDTCTLT